MQLCLVGRFVRIVDSGESLDLAGTRFLIKSLGVAFLGHVQRRIDVDLEERKAGIVVQLAHEIAISAIGADEAGDGDDPRLGEELGHLADAANVLSTVLSGEAEVLVQAVADVVAVESIGVLALLQEHLLQGDGDRALARGGETRHPQRHALLLHVLVALGRRDFAFVPGDVRCDLLSHGWFLVVRR